MAGPINMSPGTIFGRDFRIMRPLRAGGMGSVHIVEQISTGKPRALKIMAPELAGDPATRERFVLEARAASSIESDHVVETVIAGVDEDSGAPYIVMELLKGEELADSIERVGAVPVGDVAEVFSQIGHALEQAHLKGIVHRDLKPENIFLSAPKRRDTPFTAKILDFGIAKLVADAKKTGTQPLGTPLFMAPEQTDRRGKIAPGTDVWALGLIAFLLLTGRDYWREADGSLPQLLREVCMEEIAPASVRAQEFGVAHLLPQGFDNWFLRCLDRNVDARFANAGEAVRAFLQQFVPNGWQATALVINQDNSGEMSRSVQISNPALTGRTTPSRASSGVAATEFVAPPPPSAGAAVGTTGVGTGSPASLSVQNPPTGSKAWMIAVPIVLIGVGVGGFLAFGRGGEERADVGKPAASSDMPTASAAASASSAPAGAMTCPADMIHHEQGKMLMGALDASHDAKVTHKVTLSEFCLDKTEVTVDDYKQCVASAECAKSPDEVAWPGISDEAKHRWSDLCNLRMEDHGNHPINCVSWEMARDYCGFRGKRLPTEAEWEYAARGRTQRDFPWGDDPPDETRLNACGTECTTWAQAHGTNMPSLYEADDGFAGTAPVGSFKAGASERGVLDLAGNVWEWTSDWYAEYTPDDQVDPKGPTSGEQRVARGGAFNGAMAEWAKPAYRWKSDPSTYSHAIGFRCAATVGLQK